MSVAYNTPVQFLPGIGRRTAKVLHDLGIHTAGQFNNMPEAVLTELFGPSIRSVLRIINARTYSDTPAPARIEPKKAKKRLMERVRLAAQVASAI